MTATNRLKYHADLVDRMAGLQGLDLEELVLREQMDPNVVCDAVLRCSGCSNPQGCSAWMNSQVAEFEEGPAMCRNNELFAQLKQGSRV